MSEAALLDEDASAEVVKVVLLGDSGVGKSSLALRFVTNDFKPYTSSTIGASFMSKTVTVDTTSAGRKMERKIAFKIWDTAGQEKYHSLAPMYYRGSGAAIVVYDICKGATFDTLQGWVEELKNNGPPNIVLVVCGNKSDLNEYRNVDYAEARKYSEEIGAVFLEASAKDDHNVGMIFQEIARRVPVPDMKAEDTLSACEDQISGKKIKVTSEDNGQSGGWFSRC